jgi:periplasmic divalent cation tolerance protein
MDKLEKPVMRKTITNPKTHQSTNPAVALVTAPDLKTARKLAKIILQSRLAACANLVPQIESHYWWRGKLEKSAEVLMLLKTTHARLPQLQKTVLENHPYDTPEFIVLPIISGNTRYLDWVAESVQAK